MSKEGPSKKHTTNPYINLEDFGLQESDRITQDVFQEIVSNALEKNVAHYEHITHIVRCPLVYVKQKCRERLSDVPEAHLRNKTIMFSVLRTLFDEVAEILLSSESESFYQMFADQAQNFELGTVEFEEAVERLRNEDLQVIIKLLGDVAGSVRARELFYDYAKKQKVQPRGRTMIDGLKPEDSDVPPPSDPLPETPSTKKEGLYRIPSPDGKKRKATRKMRAAGVVKRVDTQTDGLFTSPPVAVAIPKMPIYVPQSHEEREVLVQGSTGPESVRFTPEPSVEQVQSDSGVDVEIASTPHEIDDEPTVDLGATLPSVETEEDSLRPTLPDAPDSIRSASGKGQEEIEDEETWINEPVVEPTPAVVPEKRAKIASQPIIPVNNLYDDEKTVVIQQPTSKRTGDLSAHVPPMRPPLASESNYNPKEPSVVLSQPKTLPPKAREEVYEEPLVELPEGKSGDDTKRLTIPSKRRSGQRNRAIAIALAGLTALGAAAVGKRFFGSSETTDTVENPHTPPTPTPSIVHTSAPPKPQPTSFPQPKPQPGPSPDPQPVTVPKSIAEFDASSVDPKNFLLKKLIEDGQFTLGKYGIGVNGQFLRMAATGANPDQTKEIAALNKKINIGVYAVAMKKFGGLSPQQIQEIKNDPSHPDHGFLMSSIAISKEFKQPWSPTVRVMKKNADGTAVYDRSGRPIFEVKDYWEAHKDAYEYGQKFVDEMKAKGYGNVHNVGKFGDAVTIEAVTYWADILDIMKVAHKTADGSGLNHKGKAGEEKSHGNQDGTPQKPGNTGKGTQGYWQPPVYNLDPQFHQHKNPTFIQPDQNPGDSITPNKYAKNNMFKADNPSDGKIMPTNIGTGNEVVRASHRVDMSFLEKDPSRQFANLFRLNRKMSVKGGETFWSVMDKAVAESGQSMFVKAAAQGVLKRWKSRGVDQMPFSVSQQTGDGLILVIDHPDFAEEMNLSLAKARKMDEFSAKKRGEVTEKKTVPAELAPELASGPLYLSAIYRPLQGVRPKDALIGDIQRSNLSPFAEAAVMRQLERIKGTPFIVKDLKNRAYVLKPEVKRQLEFAARIAVNREKKGLGNANVDMSFARPEPLKYGEILEMNGVPTNMEVPLKWHPVQYMEHMLVEKLQTRRKVLANNPNNMDLIGRLMDAEHQLKAKCAGMRRAGLNECVKMYIPAQKGQPTKVVWKSSIVESLGRIMDPLFEKPEVSLNGMQKNPAKPLPKRPLPVPRYSRVA